HLAPHLITFHMFLALVIVLITLALWIAVLPSRRRLTARSSTLGKFVLGLGLVQLILGTEVREGVDTITNSGITDRSQILDHDSLMFMIHRSFSILFLVIFFIWIAQL